MTLEIRTGELRASSPGRLTGYVARFNSETRIGDFSEVIRAGAFKSSLSDGRNIVALADHDRRALLGSTASGTLQLLEDEHGLATRGLGSRSDFLAAGAACVLYARNIRDKCGFCVASGSELPMTGLILS